MERRQKKNEKEGKEEESQREENKNSGKEIERDKEGERWAGGGKRERRFRRHREQCRRPGRAGQEQQKGKVRRQELREGRRQK